MSIADIDLTSRHVQPWIASAAFFDSVQSAELHRLRANRAVPEEENNAEKEPPPPQGFCVRARSATFNFSNYAARERDP